MVVVLHVNVYNAVISISLVTKFREKEKAYATTSDWLCLSVWYYIGY